MPNSTANYSLLKPLVNDATDEDLWGGYLNDSMDLIDTQMKVNADAIALSTTLAAVYPVGTYYINETNSTNPGTLLGFGTWTAVADKFIVARGSTYTGTGGAAEVSLSVSNMPAHTHTMPVGGTISNSDVTTVEAAQIGSRHGNVPTSSTGSGSPFSIIPTYQAAYIWKRTV